MSWFSGPFDLLLGIVSKGYFKAPRGYVIYSVNKSRVHGVPKNNGLIFHMDEVSELWRKTMVNNSRVFNLSNCSVIVKV